MQAITTEERLEKLETLVGDLSVVMSATVQQTKDNGDNMAGIISLLVDAGIIKQNIAESEIN